MRAGHKACGPICASGALAGDEEAYAVVPAKGVLASRRRPGVMDNIVAVELFLKRALVNRAFSTLKGQEASLRALAPGLTLKTTVLLS